MLINKGYGYRKINGIEMFGYWRNEGNNKKCEPKGKAIHVDDIAINMEYNSYTLILSFISFGKKILHELKLEDFNKSGLLKLAKYGADVTKNNISTLINVLQNERNDFETPLMIVVSCGLRRGELLALKWSSIDWNDKTLNITENRVQTPCNEIYTKDPKSQAGTRSIVMPNSLFDYLKLEYDRLKLCDKSFSETNYIVHMKDTKEPYRPDVFSQKFKRFLEKNHLKKIRLHDLRHTCATMMLTAGITPKVAQQILGHSEISTTLDTYSHILKRVEIDAAEKLDKQIFGE